MFKLEFTFLRLWASILVPMVILNYNNIAYAQSSVELRVVFFQASDHPIVTSTMEAFSKISDQVNGRVKFKAYPSSKLIPTVEMANGINDRTAFAGIWYMPYMAKTIPLFNIETLPVWNNANCNNVVAAYDSGLNQLYSEALAAQGLKNVRVAGVSECFPRVLASTKAIRVPKDAVGVKIRAVGVEADMYKDIGAVPINMTMDQVYEALSRKLIDGVTNAHMMIAQRNQFELMNHVVYTNLSNVLMHLIYNPELLAPLTQHDRDIVMRDLPGVAKYVRAALDVDSERIIKEATPKFKTEIVYPNPAEQKLWVEAAQKSKIAFEKQGDKDPFIKKGMDLVRKFDK